MFSNGFIPLINKPTRISHKSATLIDNFWIKDSVLPSKVDAGILTEDISDHLPIFYILSLRVTLSIFVFDKISVFKLN
jgi:hypothetical protein